MVAYIIIIFCGGKRHGRIQHGRTQDNRRKSGGIWTVSEGGGVREGDSGKISEGDQVFLQMARKPGSG